MPDAYIPWWAISPHDQALPKDVVRKLLDGEIEPEPETEPEPVVADDQPAPPPKIPPLAVDPSKLAADQAKLAEAQEAMRQAMEDANAASAAIAADTQLVAGV